MIRLRKMLDADISAGLSLCRSAQWNQLASDWKLFLDSKPGGSVVAIDDSGQVIGTVATIDYEDRFSWIGMVLVDPDKKRQGIGTRLLHEALHILRYQNTIKLDATPAGREVYLKLGFQDEYTLSRMIMQKLNQPYPEEGARTISTDDLKWILEKDREVFGASRFGLLQSLRSSYPALALTVNTSYCFGRKGFNFSQIGPVVADTFDDAIAITRAALNKIPGPVVLDVMQGSEYQKWLLAQGFAEQRQLIRMYKGSNIYPGAPGNQFAILGPEFG